MKKVMEKLEKIEKIMEKNMNQIDNIIKKFLKYE